MRCENCSTENPEGSDACSECGAPLAPDRKEPLPLADEPDSGAPLLARFLSTAWHRKGPILMALFVVLMMAMVFAPWANIELDAVVWRVSRVFSGWAIIIPRILFFLSIAPLLVSLMMVAGIGTRRRVLETHVCTFFAGVMFTVWLITFALSEVLHSVIGKVRFLELSVRGGQVTTIFLLIGFLVGLVVTTYDRGKQLQQAGLGG